jgi:large subunit ribosomal protein L1
MPRAHGKKYREAAAAIEDGKFYPPAEAVSLVRQTATTTFDASIEAHVRLGIDPRHADQVVRSTVTLPHGTGKTRRIAVFATGEKLREAVEAGADVVGGEDLVKKVQEGVIDFDVALATPEVMGMVGRAGSCPTPRRAPSPSISPRRSRMSRAGGSSSAMTERASSIPQSVKPRSTTTNCATISPL